MAAPASVQRGDRQSIPDQIESNIPLRIIQRLLRNGTACAPKITMWRPNWAEGPLYGFDGQRRSYTKMSDNYRIRPSPCREETVRSRRQPDEANGAAARRAGAKARSAPGRFDQAQARVR